MEKNTTEQKKLKFEEAKLEVICLDYEDVIRTSGEDGPDSLDRGEFDI